jgi:hypothetical protein
MGALPAAGAERLDLQADGDGAQQLLAKLKGWLPIRKIRPNPNWNRLVMRGTSHDNATTILQRGHARFFCRALAWLHGQGLELGLMGRFVFTSTAAARVYPWFPSHRLGAYRP